MATLAVFTVKTLHRHQGRHFTYGGFGDYLRAIAPYFDRTILVAHVAAKPPGHGFYELDDPRVEIAPLPETRGEAQVLRAMPAMIRQAHRVVPRADVVHARMPDYTGVIGSLVARRYRVPCFHQIIADWSEEAKRTSPWRKGGLGLLLKMHLHLYDWIERRVSAGQLVFAQGRSCHAKHARRAAAHLAVSSAHRASDVRAGRPRFTSPPWRILNVARLTQVKNQALLLRGLAELRRRGQPWELTLVGDGPHRGPLEATARKLGLDGVVEFAGMVEHGPSLWEEYDRADVFALTSRSEGTPKVLLEAMARGLPVVASDVSGVPTVVTHEANGLLFREGDVFALAASLTRMREAGDMRLRLVEAGLAAAGATTVESVTAAMMEIVFARWPHLRASSSPGSMRDRGGVGRSPGGGGEALGEANGFSAQRIEACGEVGIAIADRTRGCDDGGDPLLEELARRGRVGGGGVVGGGEVP
jgi:glycosyltransferase involved in cell wall biosynthesis